MFQVIVKGRPDTARLYFLYLIEYCIIPAFQKIFFKRRYHNEKNSLNNLESKEDLEKNGPDILSYLLTNKYFRDCVLNSNGETNGSLEEWFRKLPEFAPDVRKASAYIKSITFHENQLLPCELNDLLDSIYANEQGT